MKSRPKTAAKTSTTLLATRPTQQRQAALLETSGSAATSVPLAGAAIAQALAAHGWPAVEVETVDMTGSTNDDLLERTRLCQPGHSILRVAGWQSAGRGRQGRRWLSEPGAALLFSLAYPLQRMPSALPAVTLVCGAALAGSMRGAGIPALLKWPNDILLDGGKLAGVLCELAIDRAQRATVIIGVGINLRLHDSTRKGFDRPVAALADARKPLVDPAAREAWAARFAAALLEAVAEFEQTGFAPWVERFDALFAYRNKAVELQSPHAPRLRGVALGVDAVGQLLIEDEHGVRAISAGEVSLRVKA